MRKRRGCVLASLVVLTIVGCVLVSFGGSMAWSKWQCIHRYTRAVELPSVTPEESRQNGVYVSTLIPNPPPHPLSPPPGRVSACWIEHARSIRHTWWGCESEFLSHDDVCLLAEPLSGFELWRVEIVQQSGEIGSAVQLGGDERYSYPISNPSEMPIAAVLIWRDAGGNTVKLHQTLTEVP